MATENDINPPASCGGFSVPEEHSPLPFELVKGNEHHGPYIVNAYGGDVCDFYAMSNPFALSVRNGGDSKPVWFTDAAGNAEFMWRAANAHIALVEALGNARSMLTAFGGDPRKVIAEHGSAAGDEIQAALLDSIDEALALAEAQS